MRSELQKILLDQSDWAWWRCRDLAVSLRPPRQGEPGEQAAVDELTEEIHQAVLGRFLDRAANGWFDHRPYKALEAQVRTLLQFCILQEQSARFRQAERDHRRVTSNYENDEGEEVDPLDEVASPAPSPFDLQADEERRALLLGALSRLAHPVRKLAIKGTYLSAEVVETEVAAAASHVASGARFVIRPAGEAWALLALERERPDARDEVAWRRTFAEILRFDVPMGEPDALAVKHAVNALEKQMERGFADLRALLIDEVEP